IVEASILKQDSNTLKDLFKGSSYLEDYIETITDNHLYKYNVIIRIYDYKYEGEKKNIVHNENILNFYENIEYEKVNDFRWLL
ncbi:MAG: hypothetical protein RR630_07725, partial [Coprobacillus sp.]